jgi:hypothetical protein
MLFQAAREIALGVVVDRIEKAIHLASSRRERVMGKPERTRP